MLEDFLAKLGANTKITVGVSISPSVGLEMIEIDRVTGIVTKYAKKPLDYNYSAREITDYAQFTTALVELFEELHIPKKSNVLLNFPTVHFGIIGLPLLLTDEAVTNAIISEVEQSYIFKRHEPVVKWAEVGVDINTENRNLAYTAIQKNALDEINNSFAEVGCTLVGLEPSFASLLKALNYTEKAKEQMKENITWNLMVIGQNSYSIISLVGKRIIEYYEEPLALKSFVDDEIYNAITTSAQLTLSSLPANHLYIVSETDLVSAEVLTLKIPFENSFSFLECNKYVQTELLPVDLEILPNVAMEITPEAVGIATSSFNEFPLKLNLLTETDSGSSMLNEGGVPKINIGNLEIELTPDFIKKVSLIIGVAIVLPLIILSFILVNLQKTEQAKLDECISKTTTTTAEIAKYNTAATSGVFDVKSAIEKIISGNKIKLQYYSALGISVPEKVWVQEFTENESGGIDIKGHANNVESVYTFYKNIKQLVNNSNIRLHKLEISSDSIDDVVSDISSGPKYYAFEITNMTPEQLNPPVAPATPEGGQPAAEAPKSSIFQFGKPLFGQKEETAPAAAPAATPAATPTPTPTPTTTPSSQPLPKNLEKIEKF